MASAVLGSVVGVAWQLNAPAGQAAPAHGTEALYVQYATPTGDQARTMYPVNNSGQTYGSVVDVESPDDEPDLILAYSTDGRLGYIRKQDLGPVAKNPQEAIAIQMQNDRESIRERASNGSVVISSRPREIAVLNVDGKTVIGKFIVSGTQTEKDRG